MKGSISIEEYLNSKGIKMGEKNKINLNDLSIDDIREQIKLISKVHELINGGSHEPYLRLINTAGKEEEEFKVLLKRFCRNIKELNKSVVRNEFEQNILALSDKIIFRAEKALKNIINDKYENIILRSMKNKEVIIYYSDNSYLYNDKSIVLYKNKGVSYNFNELDIARYIYKVRNNLNEDELKLILNEYAEINRKSSESIKYIKNYLEFPQDELKLFMKYSDRADDKNKALKYLDKLKESNLYKGLL